jgi:hypothetical protein
MAVIDAALTSASGVTVHTTRGQIVLLVGRSDADALSGLIIVGFAAARQSVEGNKEEVVACRVGDRILNWQRALHRWELHRGNPDDEALILWNRNILRQMRSRGGRRQR